MSPRARQAPEVGQVFKMYLLAFQHSPFGLRFYKRTPGICAAVVHVELEAFTTVEDASELALDLAGDLEERWRAERICVGCERVWKMVLIDLVAQLGG